MIGRNKLKIKMFIPLVLVLLGTGLFMVQNAVIFSNSGYGAEAITYDFEKNSFASGMNQSDIENLLDDKVSDYSQQGHYTEYFTPSIRDMYFALYIADAIGKIGQIDKPWILQYLMSHYDSQINEFQDDYSLRFYDLVDSDAEYQNSPLITYCYAILALNIIDEMNQVPQQDIIDYILSCHDSASGGFIGIPSAISSPQNLATAENTYYAVEVLNLVNIDWGSYSTIRSQINSFCVALQMQNPGQPYYYGAFSNDFDINIETVIHWDPCMKSSWFAVQILKSFGMEDSISISALFDCLGDLYVSSTGSFNYNEFEVSSERFNMFSTAYGIELADLYSFSYDQGKSIDFLINNRLLNGGWSSSSGQSNFELMDTFEVIRYLERSGNITRLDAYDRDQIFDFILKFKGEKGFSSLSIDHYTIKNIYSTTQAFSLYNRIYDLDIQAIFTDISNTHNVYEFGGPLGDGSWYDLVTWDSRNGPGFRSMPVEYFSAKNPNVYERIGKLCSNEYVFYALSTLEALNKLGDFDLSNNLNELLENIVDCQYLDIEYGNYGGFIPDIIYTLYGSSLINDFVFMKYSYFSIRSIEILDEYLGDGDITNNGIDLNALATFISNNIVENSQSQYYDPLYSNQFTDRLENTYYVVYVLKALNMYSLNTQKIINYALSNIDYTSFKDIYFLYKLGEILGVSIDFDIDSVRTLLSDLYVEGESEYFSSNISESLSVEMIHWICEIAKNDGIRIEYTITNPGFLGYNLHVEADICNLLITNYDATKTVKFETDLLGTIALDKVGDIYSKDILLDLIPLYIPEIMGEISVYDGLEKLVSEPVFIDTSIELISEQFTRNITGAIVSSFKYTIQTSSGYTLLGGSNMYAKIYFGGDLIDTIDSVCTSQGYYTCHNVTINSFSETGMYYIEFYLKHPFLDSNIYDPQIGKLERIFYIDYPKMVLTDGPGDTPPENNTDDDDNPINGSDNSGDSNNTYNNDLIMSSITPISIILVFSSGLMVTSVAIKKKGHGKEVGSNKRESNKKEKDQGVVNL